MKKVITLLLFCCWFSACFKKLQINENALLHQKACIESIDNKDLVRAKTHCDLCIEFDSAMQECLNGLGLIALMEHDQDRARNFFTKALRQNNDFCEARNNLGVIYFLNGDFTTALNYFDRALEIDPSNMDARYNAGLSNFRLAQRLRAQKSSMASLKHLLKAKDQLKKLLAIEPNYHSAFRDLGLVELNLYDLEEFEAPRQKLLQSAKASFLHCIEADNNEDGCFEGLAQVYFEEGKWDQSTANYFICLAHAPNNSACRRGIVAAYEKSAQAENGYKQFLVNVKEDQQNAHAHEAFCAALFERGLDQEGKKECELALRIKPDLCSAHFRLGEYFASVLNPDQASNHCLAYLSCNGKAGHEIKKCQDILANLRRPQEHY